MLVKFKTSASDIDIISAIQSVDGTLINHLNKTVSLADWSTKTLANQSFVGDPYLFHVKVPSSTGTENAIKTLTLNPNVEFAEKNYIIKPSAIPSDPWFLPRQWGLNNTGENSGGTAGVDIDAPAAWDICTGSSSVVIAILDSGIFYNHPDLQANMWANPNEVLDGIDNDGNGKIDDIYGWDCANGDNDPMDDSSHGTHVAGIVGASGNNAIGIAGVCWTAKLMPVKIGILGDEYGTTAAWAVDGIDYARIKGARIINASWTLPAMSVSVLGALKRAQTGGVLFIAAAGNWDNEIVWSLNPPPPDDGGGGDGGGGIPTSCGNNVDQEPQYPACYDLDNIISVLATDYNDNIAWYSNYGLYSVDLGAPGGICDYSDYTRLGDIYSTLGEDGYGPGAGTSMAAPFVTGVAGLLLAQRSNLDWWQIKTIILKSVESVGYLVGRCRTHGRLNAYNALTYPTPILPAAPTNLSATAYSNDGFWDIKLTWRDNSNNESGFKIYLKVGDVFEEMDTVGANTTTYWLEDVGSGVWTFYVRAYRAEGESPKTENVSVNAM